MADKALPYVTAYGNITKALEKIQTASTPDRFTQDFLATKLALPGGGAKPVIPFLKRTGFLASDGSPTERYKSFRNPAHRGAAAADALRQGFAPLFVLNEYANAVDEAALKGLIVQATGAEPTASTVKSVVGSFKALNSFADFEAGSNNDQSPPDADEGGRPLGEGGSLPAGLKLGYTINLHLPATSDIAVFNAIFKSLRDNLLQP